MASIAAPLDDKAPTWTFLSNHAHVLVCVARDPQIRLRDVAYHVGITERGVTRIVGELEEAGVLSRTREGRRNHYQVNPSAKLRHPVEAGHSVGELLQTLLAPEEMERLSLASRSRKRHRRMP